MTSGRFSVARVTRAWYIACESRELRDRPLARTIFGRPLVLFREADGRPAALLDRCAHRNVPLTLGRVVEGRLECGYHGWQYDGTGACLKVPGLCGAAVKERRKVPAFPVREVDGYVWIWAEPGSAPEGEPFRFPPLEPGYTLVRRIVEAPSTLHAAAENALDVPHTSFLHRGLFRGTGKRNLITARVTRTASSVTAEYIGEPRPEGLAGKILSPSGGTVVHFDRFLLPSIAQVEYRLGTENHILVTSIGTPLEDFRTRLYATVILRTRFPGWLVKLVLTPVALRIFKQDAFILQKQTDAVRGFGGEEFVSTEIDVLGLQIWRLLRQAERGAPEDDEPDERWSREIRLEV